MHTLGLYGLAEVLNNSTGRQNRTANLKYEKMSVTTHSVC